MINSKIDNLWVVVKVESGIPTSVEAFVTKKDAERKEYNYRTKINPENDEVGIFNLTIPD